MTVEQPAPLPDPVSPLCDYMDELVESLRKLVPAALRQFDEVSIHQARVATRRLKAAIDLLEPILSDEHRKPFAKAGRQLRRRLGPMRDLDVMIDHLQKIQRRAAHRTAAHWLELRLTESRAVAREESKSDEAPSHVLARVGAWWGLREEVIEAGDQARSLLANALHLQLDAFAEQADLLAKKDALVKQDPHQVRIAGKALRYTLEMAKCEGHPIPGGVAKAFKRMQETLGNWHDFVVITERAMRESLDALLSHHDAQLQRQVLDLARWTLEGARRELDGFSVLWAQEGPELIKSIRDSVPLVTPGASPEIEPADAQATPERATPHFADAETAVPEPIAPEPATPELAADELAADELAALEPEITEPKTEPDPPGSGEAQGSAPAPASDPAAA